MLPASAGGGGSSQSSAYPDRLMNYSNIAGPDNSRLASSAQAASDAIQAFLRSNPDPSVMPPIQDVGAQVAAYAARKAAKDQWVFDVGLAFLTIGEKQLPPASQGGGPPIIPDWGAQKVRTSDAQVAQELTNNALTQQARSNADKLKKLLDKASPESLNQNKAEIQQLLKWLQFYKDDPIQAAAFFNELGPEKTLAAANAIQYLRLGDGTLTLLSQSLATASQSDTLQKDFPTKLVDASNQPPWVFPELGGSNQHEQLGLLLKAGVFSSDFLTKFGDEYLYRQGIRGGALEMDYGDPVVAPFLNALARNPQAAYSYLTGPSPMPDMPKWVVMGQQGNPSGTSRLAQLETFLSTWSMGGEGWPRGSWVSGLNQALLAADRQASESGDPGQVSTLLHDLSDADLNMVNDGYRPVIAQLVSEHIDQFVPPVDPTKPIAEQPGYDWTWAAKLFKGAVADGSGDVNGALIARIQGAVQIWSADHMPQLNPDDGQSMDRFRAYMYQVGALWGLTALPARQGGYDAQALQQEQQEAFSQILDLIPIKVPGLSNIGDEGLKSLAEYLSDQAISQGKTMLSNKLFTPSGNPGKDAVRIYYNELGGMRVMLSQKFVATHPELVSGMTPQQVQDYISQLAAGGDPNHGKNPTVSDFESQLDSASLQFSKQFALPSTS